MIQLPKKEEEIIEFGWNKSSILYTHFMVSYILRLYIFTYIYNLNLKIQFTKWFSTKIKKNLPLKYILKMESFKLNGMSVESG